MEKERKNKRGFIKNILDDKTFFKSSSFKSRLQAIATAITKSFKDAYGNLKETVTVVLDFNDSEMAEAGYTDGSKIYINSGTSLIPEDASKRERITATFGLLGHELGHVLFTNFPIMIKIQEELEKQTYVNDFLISNKGLKEFYDKYPESFVGLFHNFNNILEDPFVEKKIKDEYKGSLKEGIEELTVLLMKNTQKQLKDVKDLASLGNICLLLQSRGYLPEKLLKDFPCLNETERCFARLYGLSEPSPQERADLSLMIFNSVYETFFKEYLDNVEQQAKSNKGKNSSEKSGNKSGQSSNGASNATDSSEDNSNDNSSDSSNDSSNDGSNGSSDSNSSNKNSSSNSSSNNGSKQANDNSDSNAGSKQSRNKEIDEEINRILSGQPDKLKDCKTGDSNRTSNGLENQDAGSIKAMDKSGYKAGENVEDTLNRKYEKRGHGVTGECSERYEGIKSPENEKHVDHFVDGGKSVTDGTGYTVEEGEELEGSKSILIESIDSFLARVVESLENNKDVTVKYDEYDGDCCCDNDYHSRSKVIIHQIKNGNEEQFQEFYSKGKAISKRLQKKVIDDINAKRRGNVQFKQKKGTFDVKAYTRRTSNEDFSIFKNCKAPNRKPQISVSICIDNSGSMWGDRITNATLATIILDDFCRALSIPCMSYAHNVLHSSLDSDVHILTKFDSKKSDRSKICRMSASGCNRDGLAIRYGERLLSRRPEQVKLMFYISDGAPAAYSYGTSQAKPDFDDINRICKKDGVALIPIAIGDDIPDLEYLFGKGKVVDGRDLTKLPIEITSILAEKVKEIYSK